MKTKNLLNGKGSEPCNGSKVHKHIQEEPEDGERKSHTIVVTLTKELRNRENLTLKHHRKQELSDYDKRYSSHKLIRGRRNTISIAGTGHTDKLLGGNVGCNQRRSYSPPSKSVAGEEIVIGTFLLALFASSKEKTEENQNGKVRKNDDKIDRLESRCRNLFKNTHWI